MVDGGLCSAMTKYVLGECFRKAFGMVIKYDLTWFETNGMDCDNKGSRLFTLTTLFPNIKMDAATKDEIDFYKRHFYYNNPKPYWYDPAIFDHPQPLYFDGYAENWKYLADVQDKVLSELRFKDLELDEANRDVLSDIHEAPLSIAVHVRLGDYVRLGMAMLGEDYYSTAIEQIVSASGQGKAKVFFFSDDIDWVHSHLAPKQLPHIEWRCVDVNDIEAGYLDLLLISECDHQVSSNSSFGYWGGLLNDNDDKTVIIPMRWLPDQTRGPELAGCDTAHDYPGFQKLENFPGARKFRPFKEVWQSRKGHRGPQSGTGLSLVPRVGDIHSDTRDRGTATSSEGIMTKSPVAQVAGPNLRLRLITPDDAPYVHALRTDPHYNRHLSPVTGTVADQRQWIEGYKAEEAQCRQLYYAIERHDGTRCGLVRLYDIEKDQFTWGSWILDANKPRKAALESAVLSFGIGFDHLDLGVAKVDVRVENTHAEAFYRRLGMIETNRTEQDIFFDYPRNLFQETRHTYLQLLKG